ncbi:AraC family transcriptional regulator N-terminal domain-containing protein [Promicromonospora thailandica]|uniref:AraC-type DNA-binding protein n=1 Tax=Promicromonospora thailandica TaxID=765201 RepID=A0A9X2JUC2_9MICO|nr:AraC family transcriptional regulator [Promicromonospora thailandica]MCP2264375.1 AraC-type DNA-binding protein [Promicromonospora thailandica]BFF20931.1 AraC family transcriptional regulator [Promicromonospora thailandica]
MKADGEAATARSLDRAADLVLRRVHERGRAEALGLRLAHMTITLGLGYQRYTPSMAVVLAGRKRSIIGDDNQVWGAEHFLITPVDLPVVAGIVETDPERGFVSARWELPTAIVTEVAATMAPPSRPAEPVGRLGTWTPALADAFSRLLCLLDEPENIPVLGPLVAREVVVRLLQTDQAPRVLAAIGGDDPVVPRAVHLLTGQMADPWSLSSLASAVRASQPTLSRRFREATSMTPMQYLKRLRLGEARHRMIVLGETAAQAAAAVGYRSVPHFSRDYRGLYGAPPAADAARIREKLRLWREVEPAAAAVAEQALALTLDPTTPALTH